jgi:adenylosuccinate synthase
MSKVIAVIGAQWGDEGKGKIVDLLAERFDIVARYQGGHNAGHSVQVGDQVVRAAPAAVRHRASRQDCVLGNGMVIDPKAFFVEADRLMQQGIEVSPERVKISSRAHLILPYHRALDHTSEERLGNEKSAQRCAALVRLTKTKPAVAAFALPTRSCLMCFARASNAISKTRIASSKPTAARSSMPMRSSTRCRADRTLGPFIADTTHYLNVAATEGRSILLEGAQATLLDVDHGTYPFVTSSTTVAGGAIIGTGLAPID